MDAVGSRSERRGDHRTGLSLRARAATILSCALAIASSGWAGAPGTAANGEEPMRIIFQSEGGIAHFPGLSKPVTIDTDQLPEQAAAELRQLIESVRLFDRPAQVGSPAPGAADYRQFTITVEAGERRHTMRLVEPIEDPALQRLVRFLQEQVKALRTKAPAGDSP
jgi:hypothetical protein